MAATRGTRKRPREEKEEEEEEEEDDEEEKGNDYMDLDLEEPSFIHPTKRARNTDKPPTSAPKPHSFTPNVNDSFFADTTGNPGRSGVGNAHPSSSMWGTEPPQPGQHNGGTQIYEDMRTFDTLIHEIERDLDEKISRKVREHPLYDYCVMVIGALGRGNQQINPNLIFDTQEAKQLADTVISNMKLAMEIKLDVQRQHTLVSERKQQQETKISSVYRGLLKDETLMKLNIAYVNNITNAAYRVPLEAPEAYRELHQLLSVDTGKIMQTLESYQNYFESYRALDSKINAYINKKAESKDTPLSGTTLAKIDKAIISPIKLSNQDQSVWTDEILPHFPNEANESLRSTMKKRFKGVGMARSESDGTQGIYKAAVIYTYMALPHLLLSNGLTGTPLDVGSRLNVELFCYLVHKALANSGDPASETDNYNAVLLKLTGENYFISASTEFSIGGDIAAKDKSNDKDIRKLTQVTDLDIYAPNFHQKNMLPLSVALLEIVATIGKDRGRTNSPALEKLLVAYMRALGEIDKLYDSTEAKKEKASVKGKERKTKEEEEEGEDENKLEPIDILERRLSLSQYQAQAHFLKPLLLWHYPFISDGKTLLDRDVDVPAASWDHITGYIEEFAKDLAGPSPVAGRSKFFFDAANSDKDDLFQFVPSPVEFEYEENVIDKELKYLEDITAAMRTTEDQEDLITIANTEPLTRIPRVEHLEETQYVLDFYERLKKWLADKKQAYEARLLNIRQRIKQVKNEAKHMRVFLGAEGEILPSTVETTREENDAEKIIEDVFEERTQKMNDAIHSAMASLDRGDGIKVRADISYASQRVLSEASGINSSWARDVGSWERIARSRNSQARTFMSNAAASIINESQVVSGTRGNYLQLDIRTFNIVNGSYAIQRLIQIPSFII